MKRLLAITLCALLLAGCVTQGGPYIPTGDGLHVDTPTLPPETLPESGRVRWRMRLNSAIPTALCAKHWIYWQWH